MEYVVAIFCIVLYCMVTHTYIPVPTCFLTATSSAVTKIFLSPVGKSVKIECDGKHGGSYLWKGHNFTITLPPDCADEVVTVTIKAYLPSIMQERCLVSAVFDVTADVRTFKNPVTIRFPHCVNIKSEKDIKALHFLIFHDDSYELKKGYFEVGSSFGSIELTKFCKICIFAHIIWPFLGSLCLTLLHPTSDSTQSQGDTVTMSNPEEGSSSLINRERNITREYWELLILPKSHTEINSWHGIYCITQGTDTYWQVF